MSVAFVAHADMILPPLALYIAFGPLSLRVRHTFANNTAYELTGLIYSVLEGLDCCATPASDSWEEEREAEVVQVTHFYPFDDVHGLQSGRIPLASGIGHRFQPSGKLLLRTFYTRRGHCELNPIYFECSKCSRHLPPGYRSVWKPSVSRSPPSFAPHSVVRMNRGYLLHHQGSDVCSCSANAIQCSSRVTFHEGPSGPRRRCLLFPHFRCLRVQSLGVPYAGIFCGALLLGGDSYPENAIHSKSHSFRICSIRAFISSLHMS